MFKEISIKHGEKILQGHLLYDDNPKSWIIFAHGSGSSRKSSRNNWVAEKLVKRGFGTLLFDLLTVEEDRVFENRFDIALLSERLLSATNWLIKSEYFKNQPISYFGASTGAAAALVAASKANSSWPISSIVSRGGRPDLAGPENLKKVKRPALLLVGDLDFDVIRLNEKAQQYLQSSRLILIPGATHLFEEPGTLDKVVRLAADWFESHLTNKKAA